MRPFDRKCENIRVQRLPGCLGARTTPLKRGVNETIARIVVICAHIILAQTAPSAEPAAFCHARGYARGASTPELGSSGTATAATTGGGPVRWWQGGLQNGRRVGSVLSIKHSE